MKFPSLPIALLKRIVSEIGGRFGSHGISLLTNLLILSLLGVEGFGEFATYIAASSISSASWNLNVQGEVSVSLARGCGASAWRRYLIRASFVAGALSGLVIVIVGSLDSGHFVAALLGLSEAVYVYHRPILIAARKQDVMASALILSQLTRLAAIGVLLMFDALSPLSAALAQLPGYVAGALVHYVGARRSRWTDDGAEVAQVGGYSTATDVVAVYMRYVPTLVLFGSAGAAVTGLYDIAMRLATLVGDAVASLGLVALPRLAADKGIQYAESRRRVLVGARVMAFLAAGVFAAVFSPVVNTFADVDPDNSYTVAGVLVVLGVSAYGIARAILWGRERGSVAIFKTQVFAALLLTSVFVGVRVLDLPADVLVVAVGGVWLAAGALALGIERLDGRARCQS